MTETPAKPTPQDKRSKSTRTKIYQAAINCLDTLGYAETTFAQIQAKAGVSRGAITHHFPNKQDLVAATALFLLENAQGPVERQQSGTQPADLSVYDLIMNSWNGIVNSSGGRAIVEILVACRTDSELFQLLETSLHDWDQANLTLIARSYTSATGDREDTDLLWSITRNFLRGLILHEGFVNDPAYLARMVDRFARIMDGQLIVRPSEQPIPQEETK